MMIDETESSSFKGRSRLEDGMEDTEKDEEDRIYLSSEEKLRIYQPWAFSIIVKVFGKRISHQYLKKKLTILWKVSEEIILIDLGHDYFIVKFLKEENLQKKITKWPMVRKWLFFWIS